MTDGYITWNRHAEANVRVGQFKTPFGFEQLYSDTRLHTIERSLANDRLTLSRQIGAQVGGDFLEKRLSYARGSFQRQQRQQQLQRQRPVPLGGPAGGHSLAGASWERLPRPGP